VPHRCLLVVLAIVAACSQPQATRREPDSARAAFARSVDSLLLDTQVHEIRGVVMVKVPNPVVGDESPLVDQRFQHDAEPGPHTMNGTLYAEVGALRRLLGDGLPVEIGEDRVFVGRNPEVLIFGHKHGDAMFVPVKLFARQYGAFVDIRCTLANCGFIWPRPVIEHMKHIGFINGTGMLEGHAEGIVSGINVRRLPTGD
jgi:hypothetical protein